eukprot:7126397-Pyramimonas_sp.AAC.1
MITHFSHRLTAGATSDDAERHGLIFGVETALLHGVEDLVVEGDNISAIYQTGGKWMVFENRVL